jgi:hypothetical protein
MRSMPQHQYSKQYLEYSNEYQEYIAIRDMCKMMIALHEEDFDAAVDAWKKHEGPHYRLVRQAISMFNIFLVRKDQDPAEWARGYDASAGAEDESVRAMCRMTIALHQQDEDRAIDIWGSYPNARLAIETIGWLTLYLVRDGQDPLEWARGYESYAAQQAGCRPSLSDEKAEMLDRDVIRNDQPEESVGSVMNTTTCHYCEQPPAIRLWLDRESFEELNGPQRGPEAEKMFSASFFACTTHKMSLVRALGQMAKSTEVVRGEELA